SAVCSSDIVELITCLGKNGKQLSSTECCRRAGHGEMNGDGLIAVSEAGTDESQFDFPAIGEQALRRAIGGLRLEAQGLDPQTGWIDDLKDDGIGLCHLPSDGVGSREHAVDRRDERLRLTVGAVEIGAALIQPLKLEFGILKLI